MKAIKEVQYSQTGYEQRSPVLERSCSSLRVGKVCCLQRAIAETTLAGLMRSDTIYAVADRIRCRLPKTVLCGLHLMHAAALLPIFRPIATPCLRRTGLSAAGKLSVLATAAVSAKR